MIEEVVSVELPVHERLVVRKNRLMNKDENHSTPRISIVTGTHGDELDGQLRALISGSCLCAEDEGSRNDIHIRVIF